MIVLRLTPDGLGLRLDAALRAEDRHGAVQHAQGALHLNGEVDVAGGVDDVQAIVLPVAGGGSRGDGDAALLLLSHPVHGRGAFVRLADLAVLTGVVKNTLGRSRLAGINMRHDTDVANHFKFMVSGHVQSPFFSGCAGHRPAQYAKEITSGSGRTPCWPRPYGAFLPCA